MARRFVPCACVLAALLTAPALAEVAAKPATPLVIPARANWEFSGDGGATWSPKPPTVAGGRAGTILARATFNVPHPGAASFWKLTHALPPRMRMSFRLNDRQVPLPLPGMYYKTIPGIPAGLLRKGGNVLQAQIRIDNRPPRHDRRRAMPDLTLAAPDSPPVLEPQTLRFQTGPILGAFGEDYFTVTCRTAVPATVKLTSRPTAFAVNNVAASGTTEAVSPTGLLHRFRVPRSKWATELTYRLEAKLGNATASLGPHTFSLPAFEGKAGRANGHMRFVIMGDSRTNRDDWAVVAAAVLKEKPDFVVFTGDMCDHGTNDWEWDEHYLGPPAARELLATVPYYPVKGNHEENAPLCSELFYTPSDDGRAENWAQQIGPVLLIGINGQWSPRWRQTRTWIERTLSESSARFIFFMSHYPAYSSAGNGRLDPRTGLPRHWAYLTGRREIVPLLVKHEATAFVVGHEHHYERSELPGGLPQIISGGAGAPRSGKSRDARKQNPYSRFLVKTLNYCLFEVKRDRCTLKAKTPEGTVIDTLTWQARKLD